MQRPIYNDNQERADATVWLVEDNEEFRNSVEDLINQTDGLDCVLAVSSCEKTLEGLETDAAPDVILMDIGLPGMNGIEGVRRVKSIAPSVDVIMLTVFDDEDKVFQAICAGASGYLLKSDPPDKIVNSLKEILTGGAPVNAKIARKMIALFSHIAAPKEDYSLTAAEKKILGLLAEGEPTKQIAHLLKVSYHTVDTHIRNIYLKLQVHSRSGAVGKAMKERLL
jgi:DNA-binding NarL/FixJ family response regulator